MQPYFNPTRRFMQKKMEDDLKNFKMEDDLKNFIMEDDLKNFNPTIRFMQKNWSI